MNNSTVSRRTITRLAPTPSYSTKQLTYSSRELLYFPFTPFFVLFGNIMRADGRVFDPKSFTPTIESGLRTRPLHQALGDLVSKEIEASMNCYGQGPLVSHAIQWICYREERCTRVGVDRLLQLLDPLVGPIKQPLSLILGSLPRCGK